MELPQKLLKAVRKKYGRAGLKMSDKGIVLAVLSEYLYEANVDHYTKLKT